MKNTCVTAMALFIFIAVIGYAQQAKTHSSKPVVHISRKMLKDLKKDLGALRVRLVKLEAAFTLLPYFQIATLGGYTKKQLVYEQEAVDLDNEFFAFDQRFHKIEDAVQGQYGVDTRDFFSHRLEAYHARMDAITNNIRVAREMIPNNRQ